MTDKVIKGEYTDAMGKWVLYDDYTMELVEESKEWLARKEEMKNEVTKREPSMEDFMLDLDFRVSMVELGM